MFVNGIRVATASTSATVGSSGDVVYIGNQWFAVEAARQLQGYISNARVLIGSSAYDATSTTITVPTAPLTAITNTSLLTCQSNRFIDNSTNAFAITVNGDTSVQPFSPFNPITAYSTSTVGGSGYFDGSGDYLTTASSTSLALGSGDFTVDVWFYPTTTNTYFPIDFRTGCTLYFYVTSGTTVNVAIGGNSETTFTGVVTNAWNHFACVRSGSGSNNVSYYLNGVRGAQQTDTTNFSSATTITLGKRYTAFSGNEFYLAGYLGSTRLVVGTAVYSGATYTVPTAPLTAITNTSLLCNFTNGAIFDNAAVADYETVGNAQISTSVKKYGTGSMYFDGSGDYLAVRDNTLTRLSGEDFTVEAWVYLTGNQPQFDGGIASYGAASTSAGWTIALTGSSAGGTLNRLVYGVNASASGGAPLYGVSGVPLNTWTHVAVVKIGTTVKFYINGNLDTSGTVTATPTVSSSYFFYVGTQAYDPTATTRQFAGYIDDFRISKGVGRYPYNFTPPTAAFPNIGGTVTLTADPYFEYTTLLLPGNGTNGAQNNTFLDSSSNAFSITRNGNTTQGTFSPFSQTGWGNYFDGTGDYLTTNATQAIPATGDFTVDGWIWCNSYANGPSIISQGTAGTSGRTVIYITTAGKLALQITSTINEFGSAIPTNQWVYFAITRTGSTVTGYINGSSLGTATNSGSIQNTTLTIGGEWNGDPYRWVGYLSNIRVSNVVRTITAAPTAPFTSDANTVVLTCQSNRFIDASSNAYTITRNGDVSVQAFSPFNPTASWSAATYGGSGYFDGSGDYLSGIGTTSSFNFMHDSSALWTFECWVYLPSPSTNQYILDNCDGSTAQIGVLIGVESSKLYFAINRGASGTSVASGSSTDNVPANQWVHIAITYDQSLGSSNGKFYINGVASGTVNKTANAPSGSNASNAMRVGAFASGSGPVTGYLSNLRISNSIVYSSAFTPPTAPVTGGSLLLNFTNAGIYDATSKNDLETVGNAQISTTQSKFGGSSMYFDGTDDRLVAASSPNIAFGTGDFTIEAWVRPADVSNANNRGWLQTSDTAGGLKTTYTTGVTATFGAYSNGTVFTNVGGTEYYSAAGAVSANNWYHIAITRYGGAVKLFLDGAVVASGTGNTANLSGQNICVGGYYSTSYLFSGYLQDLRITKGIARYTSNFIPPTTAFLTL